MQCSSDECEGVYEDLLKLKGQGLHRGSEKFHARTDKLVRESHCLTMYNEELNCGLFPPRPFMYTKPPNPLYTYQHREGIGPPPILSMP